MNTSNSILDKPIIDDIPYGLNELKEIDFDILVNNIIKQGIYNGVINLPKGTVLVLSPQHYIELLKLFLRVTLR